jgi:hypothetical protein
MSRNTIIVLIYHCHKRLDLVSVKVSILLGPPAEQDSTLQSTSSFGRVMNQSYKKCDASVLIRRPSRVLTVAYQDGHLRT